MRVARSLFFLAVLVGSGCSHRSTIDPEPCQDLEGRRISQQDVLALSGADPQKKLFAEASVDRFLNRYFAVFSEHEEPLISKRWAWAAYDDGSMVLDDLQPASHDWFVAMDEEAAWERTGLIDRPGISLVTTSLRAMPSERLLVSQSSQRRQGFAFDLLQNSLVNANEPLWLSHQSASGKWLFVFTSYASGWLLSRDAAVLAEGHDLAWPALPPVVCIEDGYPIRDHGGRFLFESRIGMVLPLVERDSEEFRVLVATSKGSEGEAEFEVVSLSDEVAVALPKTASPGEFSLVASRLLGLPYGWGGLYGNRDCSAAIRDLFLPFGLWLPRNSRQQAKIGEVVDLANLGDCEKRDLILDRGVAFATLLYKKGHVALYVGHRDGVPIVLHSVWDLSTIEGRRPKRRHIGRIVLSPLKAPAPGDRCMEGSTLLSDLQSMNILAR